MFIDRLKKIKYSTIIQAIQIFINTNKYVTVKENIPLLFFLFISINNIAFIRHSKKNQPVAIQPSGSDGVYTFNNHWHQTLFGSFRPCPQCIF